MAGLLRDRGRRFGCASEKLPPPQPPARHSDGGEVAGRLPPDPPLRLAVRRRGGGRRRRRGVTKLKWREAICWGAGLLPHPLAFSFSLSWGFLLLLLL